MEIPSPRSSRKARIEIIPLIDIIFFLLATFVMVSLSMVKSKGVPVNLPIASTGVQEDREEFTSITVSAENQIYFNRQPVSETELTELLQKVKSGDSDPKVFLNGDADSRLGVTIAVLDQVRRCGITKIAFETKPK
jgi:biopolymer transport protein ExbD